MRTTLSESGTVLPPHLIILGIRGVPAAHGGFESFAEQLVPWMVHNGWRVTVYCQGSESGKRYEDCWEGCRRIHIPVKSTGSLATIEFDVKSTRDAVRQEGVLLTLGYNTGFLSAYARLRGCTNVINMDGIEWKRAKYSNAQKAYLWLNERLASISGSLLIADHPQIAAHHSKHANAQKIKMIPYGSDEVNRAELNALLRFEIKQDNFFTVIARPEPENSLLEIVRAFSRKPRGANLVVLGGLRPDHPYQAKILSVASKEVIFPGAIYDKPTLHALRFYSLAYVHGHQVGGTNPSLVEALGAGNAVIAHDNPFNRWVAGPAAKFFTNEDEIERHFEHLLHSESTRKSLRAYAKQRWKEDFTWEKILTSYQIMFEEVRKQNRISLSSRALT